MADHSVPPEFLQNVESMAQFAETIKMIRDAAEQNYAVTLAPAQCQSVIWAMRLLRADSERSDG